MDVLFYINLGNQYIWKKNGIICGRNSVYGMSNLTVKLLPHIDKSVFSVSVEEVSIQLNSFATVNSSNSLKTN